MAKFLQARRRPGKYKQKKRWTAKKLEASICNSVQLQEQTDAKLSWYLILISSVWFRFPNIRNPLKSIVWSIMNPFISLFVWSYSSLKKQINLVKNTFAPPIICQRELRTLRKRLHRLEIEFLKLQLSLPDKGTNSSASGNSICRSCQQATTASSIKESNVQAAEECTLPSLLPPVPPPPPPPLPPPPPPPPPVPFSPALLFQNRLPILKKTGTNRPPKEQPAKPEGPIQITLKDLLNVKLRNAKDNNERQKMAVHKYDVVPQITISALKGVSLKSASKVQPRRLAHVFRDAHSKSPLDLRRHLRKVNMSRSPGGTPIYDRDNKENGTGLTPLMTRALRQKFQMAHPKSPSPLRMSPGNRGLEEAC
ncbi:proline-rich protein 11 [Rana temporaria]|uniref:proline-rich protein 11 n=1 Tax=Rana temporaria TaxID=8407 RepID=UPI001AAD58AB|nr:proline-rich protein 11 [Rana temporaria]